MSSIQALCAAALVMLLAPAGAQAQVFPFFGDQGPFLNRADFAQADAAARKLFEPKPAAKALSPTGPTHRQATAAA